jgi:hypothetical protein
MGEMDDIKKIEAPLIAVLWKGEQCFVKVRELRDIEIRAIGNMSLIKIENLPIKPDDRLWAEYSEQQHLIVKAALVSPTYEEIFALAKLEGVAKEAEETFKSLNKDISAMAKGPERKLYEQRAASLRALFELALPEDFLAGVSQFALGLNNSDIKLITKDILYDCAILQANCGGRPSDYCHGVFTEFNKRDIDNAALYVYAERKKADNLKKGIK